MSLKYLKYRVSDLVDMIWGLSTTIAPILSVAVMLAILYAVIFGRCS